MSGIWLNIGCGDKHLKGFVNMDIAPPYDRRLDARKGLPFADRSVDGIYSEHFFEHLTQAEGLRFLRDCRRVLKPGGRIRIAMPDLDEIVNRYQREDWRGDGDMFRLGFDWVDNRCEMLNIALREWGHQHVYNEEELRRIAGLAGLRALGRVGHGESDLPMFRGLETRPGSRLIMEFAPRPALAPDAMPLVSILIPAYKPEFFREALQSALDQRYPNLEIIVADDSPGELIGEMTQAIHDPRLRYVRNAPAKGQMENYLSLIDLARGDYLKYLNDDDLLHPDCVARMVEAFRVDGVALATSYRALIDAEGQPLADQIFNQPLFSRDMVIEGGSLATRLLLFRINAVGEPTCILFRKEDAAWIRPHPFAFGGYGRERSGAADVGLALNLLSQGDAVYFGEALSRVRISPLQWSNTSDARLWALTTWRHFRWHAARLGLLERRSLGWRLKCRPLHDTGPWRRMLRMNWRIFLIQGNWLYGLLRAKLRGLA